MRFCSPSSALSVLLCAAATLPHALAQSATQADPASQTTTLKVDARLVVVPVTVRDNKDHFIRTLAKDDFTLTVDGKPQSIRYFDREDDLPLTVGLLVDVSGSQRTVLDSERTASSAFLDGMLTPGRDRAFVVQFGKSADLLADVTPSLPRLQAGLQKIEADTDSRPSFRNGDPNDSGNSNDPNDTGSGNNGGYGGRRGGRGGQGGGSSRGGGTVLYDAVYLSSNEVLKKAPTAPAESKAVAGSDASAKSTVTSGPSRKAIILLTDGDDRGSKESLTDAIEAAQRTDATIYAIYYKGEEDHGGGGGGFPGHIPGMGGGGRGGGGFPGGGGRTGGGGGGERRVDGKKILERMADETGGRVYEVSKKLPLTEIYRQIAEELRSQYRLGFSPGNNEPGYHKLIVDTPKQKKVILQARDGYYTGGEMR
ncbi:VWA domain-containing protein [Terriglobus roseus]|uniref:VWFA-related domain-containing protein n=1 Tax=Terriglobus roseus TaxID=392734 RepID=A0A1H4Q199_9BACT|nr:VWA domain-containing protein [Terriglobus roseus]SEC13379.1 VWFA-related domain-containing protein [Terriglobus roseus]